MGGLSLLEAGALGIAAVVLISCMVQLFLSNRAKDRIIAQMTKDRGEMSSKVADALLAVNVTMARQESILMGLLQFLPRSETPSHSGSPKS